MSDPASDGGDADYKMEDAEDPGTFELPEVGSTDARCCCAACTRQGAARLPTALLYRPMPLLGS